MTVSLKGVGAITLFVADLQRSRLFYQDVFGLQVIYEDENSAVFNFENTIINLLSIPAARELIEPGAVASPESGSRFQLSIWVDDTDAACAELKARGVELLNGPLNREWGKRTASFADPDGNIWEIAQELSSADPLAQGGTDSLG
jgi:lactoylglutathione lyase